MNCYLESCIGLGFKKYQVIMLYYILKIDKLLCYM